MGDLTKKDTYTFWLTDPTILYRDNYYLDFFPTSKMSRVEQLNSITRFMIYFTILIILLKKDIKWIQFPIVIIIFIIFLYYTFDSDGPGLRRELYRVKGYKLADPDQNLDIEHFDGNPYDLDKKKDIVIESGFYDSDNKLQVGEYMSANERPSNNINYNLAEFTQFKDAFARQPSPDNPFMNLNANDFNIEDPPAPANADDDEISDKITEAFDEDLYRDIEDMYERKNSQRQFYTVPVPVNPPDTIALAHWLFRGAENPCKVDQSNCLKYEDLRFKRDSIIPAQTFR